MFQENVNSKFWKIISCELSQLKDILGDFKYDTLVCHIDGIDSLHNIHMIYDQKNKVCYDFVTNRPLGDVIYEQVNEQTLNMVGKVICDGFINPSLIKELSLSVKVQYVTWIGNAEYYDYFVFNNGVIYSYSDSLSQLETI